MRLIDADALISSVLKKAIDDAFLNGNTDMHRLLIQVIAHQPTIDAVPLDGSFLKMSRGDYLIYKRHWLYEHFDMEMDIQRSAMKSMGYEPALKDAEPHWIPCGERLPEEKGEYLVTYHPCYWDDVKDEIRVGIDTFRGRTTWAKKKHQRVIAWMPLPKPYEVEE